MSSLKREFLELLDRDLEFRYAVAGYLGLSEILKRLDMITEELKSLREEQIKLSEEQKNLREEQIKLREEQIKLREEQIKLREEQIKLGEELKSLREEQIKLGEEQKNLREEQIKLSEELKSLREEFNRMFRAFDVRLSRVERTLEKLTIDVEDEARSIIKYRLRDVGISVELTSLALPDLEINVYGVSDDVCVIGEATVRAGAGIMDELLDKLRRLRADYPERLRDRIVLVLYVSLPMQDLIDRARSMDIWLLKAVEEFHRPKMLMRSLSEIC